MTTKCCYGACTLAKGCYREEQRENRDKPQVSRFIEVGVWAVAIAWGLMAVGSVALLLVYLIVR